MFEYLSAEERTRVVKATLRWQRNVMMAKALMFTAIGLAVVVWAFNP